MATEHASDLPFHPRELMVVAAARQIRDGEVVFVGMRLPLLAFALAKRTHAPHAFGLFECGLLRDTPPPQLLYTMGDAPNVPDALWATRMINVMGLLQQGVVDVGFIGAAQVDRFGNLNTSYIGDFRRPTTKLPGSGGGADIASLARRLVVLMEHDRRRLVERVDYITSPGYREGAGGRERAGLPRGGPAAIITTMAVLGFDPLTKEAVLRSYHPGLTIEQVKQNTGWDLKVADDVMETLPPTPDELAIIREYDPQGFWTR